ncbi:MAG: mechanosensitive ion channel family protein [Planctomycetota bacterium]|jgi:small conductance mechanosensitive channel
MICTRTSPRRALLAACAVTAAACLVPRKAGAGEAAGPLGPLGSEQARAEGASLVGEWTARVGSRDVALVLSGDGRYALGGARGAYALKGDALALTPEGGEALEYAFRLDGDALVLSGGDLRGEVRFTRQPGVAGLVGWLFDVSRESAALKAWRLLIIVAIALAARLLIALLKVMSRFLIVSERGPLRYLYRRRKNRSLTIHSLVLNAVKYVVYIIALGVALSELGINYVAYVASLSVVGLAVGFGAQGLVQDFVSGVFIVIEGQFDVGDMVEISGQTGVVEELGLRMTRVRNCQGQLVVIPNRRIAVVANYSRGGQRLLVDVAAADEKAAAEVSKVARAVAEDVANEFGRVVLEAPEALPPVVLEGGVFARVGVLVWPGQQWVVNDQLVPRLRERLKAAEIEIPGDRVVVFTPAGEAPPDDTAARDKQVSDAGPGG